MIHEYASPQSYERGLDYYEQGAVLSVIRRGQQLLAEVEGSQYLPYQVRITFDAGGILDAACSCPYDWGGWCKHIVATLLTCIHAPEAIEERPSLKTLLADLDRDQLQALILELAEQRPELVDLVEAHVQSLRAQAEWEASQDRPRQRRTPLNPEAFRRQVRAILHSLDYMRPSEAYWHVGEVVNQVRRVLDQAWSFIEAGDGHSALVILEAITEAYTKDWTMLDDSNGEASGFFYDLGPAWIEALLTADLSPQERKKWADQLTRWQDELDDYGMEAVFDAAQAAALQGWDYPPLQRVLQGEITKLGAWEGEAPWYADELAIARLNVLARQGRHQEYIYLAKAEGQIELGLAMLAQLGQIQEAVEEGLQYLSTAGEALALAQALRKRGAIKEALRIAEHGLTLQGKKAPLARWLRDLATSVGETERALDAALIAFRESPSQADYQAIQELASEHWPELRAELLAHLRQVPGYSEAQVDIFLQEGLIDDAIAAVEKSANYAVIERVVNAAVKSRPDWAIRACLQQAEPIIEEGRSRYYHHAVHWLEKAQAAYQAAGREEEWRDYLEQLIRRHQRKHKLMGMLEILRR
ncbi:MAG: SWIM zinc finger domain-containing protein [Chloroflexi bacterium]|nr:SWIM zinc finger domain-containing protein [Chloroflexota bacterium]